MDDEIRNDQNNPSDPNSNVQLDGCNACQQNPCVCSDKSDESKLESPKTDSKNDEKPAKTKPPKISWI